MELEHPAYEAMVEMSRQHLLNPEVGDFWQEMFAPVCVVLEVNPSCITICRKVTHQDKDHWTWDLDKTEHMMLADWRKWLRYPTDDSKTWAHTGWKHEWAVGIYLQKRMESGHGN